jgi:hypothetical protein
MAVPPEALDRDETLTGMMLKTPFDREMQCPDYCVGVNMLDISL